MFFHEPTLVSQLHESRVVSSGEHQRGYENLVAD